jgi:hypothetical protein
MDYQDIDAMEASIPTETELIRAHRTYARIVLTMTPGEFAAWRKEMYAEAAMCDWPDWALGDPEPIEAIDAAETGRAYIADGKTVSEAMDLISEWLDAICL